MTKYGWMSANHTVGIQIGSGGGEADSLRRQFARSLKVAALCTFASCPVVDPRVYDGLELSAEIGALELDLLDQRRCVAVCLLVGTVPPHRVWTPFRPCALDDQTHCVGEAHGRVRCVGCRKRMQIRISRLLIAAEE